MQDEVVGKVKNKIELIHLNYLANNFNLEPSSTTDISGAKADLVGLDEGAIVALFEMKSRVYPITQYRAEEGIKDRPKTSFGWWYLDDIQIQRYETARAIGGYNLNWIFILATIAQRFHRVQTVQEEAILKREIYVVPWEIYTQVHSNQNCRHNGYRNLGLARILRHDKFISQQIPKGTLHIATSIEEDVQHYFSLRTT